MHWVTVSWREELELELSQITWVCVRTRTVVTFKSLDAPPFKWLWKWQRFDAHSCRYPTPPPPPPCMGTWCNYFRESKTLPSLVLRIWTDFLEYHECLSAEDWRRRFRPRRVLNRDKYWHSSKLYYYSLSCPLSVYCCICISLSFIPFPFFC